MKIVIEVTPDELCEMNMIESYELEDYVIESLESSCPQGNIDLSAYNVYVKVVDEKVI